MTKKKATKTKKSSLMKKAKSFYIHHKILGIILIILAGWILIWLGQVSVERYRLYQAERKLDKLVVILEKELGNNIKFTKDRTCGYSSAKFSRGDRGCSIYYKYELVSPTLEQSTAFAEKLIDTSIKTNEFKNKKVGINELPFNKKFEGLNPGSKTQKVSIYLNDLKKDPFCSSSATYTAYSQESQDIGAEESLELLVGCNSSAKWEYFPVPK